MELISQGYVDIHSHILPGVDDGSRDMDMTRNMLQMAWSEGIRTMIATPHYRRGYVHVSAETWKEVYQVVCSEAKKIDSDFRIYLGNELFNSHSLEDKLARGEVLTMADTSYVLVEFLPSDTYRELQSAVRRLRMAGYSPIIAHAERYTCLLKEPALTEELVDLGCYIQINTASVTGENGYAAKRYVKKLLKYELVHFLGTDTHDLGKRKPAMKKCLAYIAGKYGKEYALRIGRENALRLLENYPILK